MSKKSNILPLIFLLIYTSHLLALEVDNDFSERLKINNGYLDKNFKSDFLAYIMIYYNNLKREVQNVNIDNNNHINELAILLASFKNYSSDKSYNLIVRNLQESDSPVIFYNKIK